MAAGYLDANARSPYCKGCGHQLVLRALGEALERLALPPADVAIVTDIGCVGLADSQFATPHTVHTTHGRSTAFAAGMAMADRALGAGRLKPVVLIGDGGAMIGISHLLHAALVNPDVTVLVHNNFLFGMTGGQNSAFSPLEFVTATTPGGNSVPPMDLGRVLTAARASFVARKLAGDCDLSEVIARAIAHPGFAVVEILELCTAYATRWNTLTGAKLREVAEAAGYELGILAELPRAVFGSEPRAPAAAPERPNKAAATEAAKLDRRLGIVLAGTAGERVQTAATLLATAAMRAGLYVSQKNDNPVTQGTGFSVSEVILCPEPILFTGIEAPDAVLVVSADGARELAANGTLERVTAQTSVHADEDIELPPLSGAVRRYPFRKVAGAKLAALVATVEWAESRGLLPAGALRDAVRARYPKEAANLDAALERLHAART
jgi:pyruvate/2-oxoacid:ferredoxin oxidoreductase beta subunit/Pyruvate/2-oxoacid:ferredoxin oxidoreductase gamma subunit